LLVLQDVFGTHGVVAMRRSQEQAADIQKEIDHLNEENQKLQEHVRALKSDPAEIERVAREDMGLARPGEYIFKIQPKPGAQPDQPAKKP
jgi:cell division protein FtsB